MLFVNVKECHGSDDRRYFKRIAMVILAIHDKVPWH
jgi:hypothetical protein